MVLGIAKSTGLARMSFSVPLGNLYIIAQKPLAGARG
jgi:hypothetical protein